MDIKLVASTKDLREVDNMLELGVNCARVCYTKKDWDELMVEDINRDLLERLIGSGHHSTMEHVNLTFYFDQIPKALAMIFNNEKQYATSEKSARYTVMKNIEPTQKELYDKWMEILKSEISSDYPKFDEKAIKKLAQENARYMISVFTPTKMIHTINLRQLNFIQQEFENFIGKYTGSEDEYRRRLASGMKEFLEQTSNLRVNGLNNQTNRHLSFWSDKKLEDIARSESDFEDNGLNYSTKYPVSFAAFAQLHRHRTIDYNVLGNIECGSPLGFYIPRIIRENTGKEQEWVDDLSSVAENDFPQGQLIEVYERGNIEDFRSKALLRLCGHAQIEIMENTLNSLLKYETYRKVYGENSNKPKCLQGKKCSSPCVWSGNKALERLV